KLIDHSRLVEAQWDMKHVRPHNVAIKVVARDRVGLLRDITDAISQENASIVDNRSWVDEEKKIAVLRFTVQIISKEQMTHVAARIRRVSGVTGLTPYVRSS
ncbi:ACT domain-containing protein, partial [Candidatus Sumerlaeota bacterium]|nr:ACT domain-containing protein [Candidatus Sumerlaeota bacterium]